MNQILLSWLKSNLIKQKTINYDFDTSHIRITFENDEVNDALLQLGYCSPNPVNDPYRHVDVSAQSPALIKYRNEVLGPH